MANPAELRLVVGARSEVGPRRPSNQDSGYAADRVLLIADGVGGSPAGDLASALVVRTLAGALTTTAALSQSALFDRVVLTNAQLARATRRNPELRGMATTLTGLVLTDAGAFIAHVGDSRAYRWRAGVLEQMTIDQSWIQMLLAEGLVKPDEVRRHPMRNLLLHSLSGALADADALHLLPVDVAPGDRWLLATDGLSSYLPHQIFADLVTAVDDPQELADRLVSECWTRTRDNISVVIGVVHSAPSSPATNQAPLLVGAAADRATDSLRAV